MGELHGRGTRYGKQRSISPSETWRTTHLTKSPNDLYITVHSIGMTVYSVPVVCDNDALFIFIIHCMHNSNE